MPVDSNWWESRLRSTRAKAEEATSWGWPGPPETLQKGQLPPSFKELLKRPEARHKSLRELRAFLTRFEYPYIDSGRIPIAGYEKILALRDAKKRDQKRDQKRKERRRNRAKFRIVK
jgi:hypothetical protein